MKPVHRLLIAILLAWAWQPIWSAEHEIPGFASCSGMVAGDGHQLFTPPERAQTAKDLGLQKLFVRASQPEKSLVSQAIEIFRKYSPGLGARQKAILWETLAEEVDRALPGNDHRVSYGFFRPTENGMTYVFQGPLRFRHGLHYTLIIDAEGRVLTGLAPLIRNIANWKPWAGLRDPLTRTSSSISAPLAE